MRFAIAKGVITPKEPVFMAGFATRTEKSIGVHDDIFAKAVLLESNQTLLILTFDVVGGDRNFVHDIKQALLERFGLQAQDILINFSHAHSAIALTGETSKFRRTTYSMGGGEIYSQSPGESMDYSPDIAYFHSLRPIILNLVEVCYAHLEEGSIEIGKTQTDISVNRRTVTDSGVIWAPNYGAAIDKDLMVLKLTNAKGVMKGIIFSHGCHPSAMNNYEISAEFVGHACHCLEEQFPDATAIFMQGCAAEIKPLKSANGDRFKLCTFEEMMEIGWDLAQDVIGLIASGEFHPIHPSFSARLLDVKLYSQIVSASEYRERLEDPSLSEILRPLYTRLIAAIEDGSSLDSLQQYIQIWHLDEETRIIALEHEIPTDYSLILKKLFNREKTIVLGYSNGLFTYVGTKKMIAEGGYEVDRALLYRAFVGPFVPEIEDIIIGQIARAELIERETIQEVDTFVD